MTKEKKELELVSIKLIKSKRKRVDFECVEKLAESIGNGFIILWQHHEIFVGEIKNKEIEWCDNKSMIKDDLFINHFVQLRAFDETKEFYFWKTAHEIKGRLREDGMDDSKDVPFIKSDLVLREVIANQLLKLDKYKGKSNLKVITRNYINEEGQAGYVDSRFVDFV